MHENFSSYPFLTHGVFHDFLGELVLMAIPLPICILGGNNAFPQHDNDFSINVIKIFIPYFLIIS